MSEVSGRIKMQSFADFKNWAWTPTVNEFDRFDGFLKGKAKTAIVEIKDREEKCEKYWSHWIETNKLNNLLELKNIITVIMHGI